MNMFKRTPIARDVFDGGEAPRHEVDWQPSEYVHVAAPSPFLDVNHLRNTINNLPYMPPIPPAPPINDPHKKRVYGWDDVPLPAEEKLDNLFHAVTHVLQVLKTAYSTHNPLAYSQLLTHKHILKNGLSFIAFGGNRSGYCFHMREPGGNHFQVYAHRVGWAQNERDMYPAWDALQSQYDAKLPGRLHLPKHPAYGKQIEERNRHLYSLTITELRKLYKPPHTHEPERGTVDWVIKNAILCKEGGEGLPLWEVNEVCKKSGW